MSAADPTPAPAVDRADRARKTRPWIRLVAGGLVAALFVWLLFRQVNPGGMSAILRDASLSWVLVALVCVLLGYACRTARWGAMLRKENPDIRWVDCAGPLFASFAANNVLPFRAGDVMRAIAFNARLGTSAGGVFATLFAERVLDLLTVLLCAGLALLAFGMQVRSQLEAGGWLILCVAGSLFAVLVWPRIVIRPAERLADYCARRGGPGVRLAEEIRKACAMLGALSGGGQLVPLLSWSAAIWMFEGAVFWCSARALALTHPEAGWFAMPFATLSTLIPGTPGYVGTFDYFTTRALASLANEPTRALACAVLVHAILWLPPTLIGGLYLAARARVRRPSEREA